MKLVFICGALRSGTSMLHLMLNSHPKLSNPGEFDFLFDGLNGVDHNPTAQEYSGFLKNNRIFKAKSLRIDTEPETYHELLNNLVAQLDDGNILCLNLHRNFDWALHYFPDAKFIHILRDPRDVAKSSIRMGWAGNTYYGVDHWVDTEDSWDRLVARANPTNYFEFRYEDLIADLHGNLSALCGFVGTDYDTVMLDYHENSTYSPPDISLTQQWKRVQQPREIELVEHKAYQLMIKRGYEVTSANPIAPRFYERLHLWVLNKAYKYRFSIKRYGLALWVIQKLITAFPRFPGAGKYRDRIHLIQISHLK